MLPTVRLVPFLSLPCQSMLLNLYSRVPIANIPLTIIPSLIPVVHALAENVGGAYAALRLNLIARVSFIDFEGALNIVKATPPKELKARATVRALESLFQCGRATSAGEHLTALWRSVRDIGVDFDTRMLRLLCELFMSTEQWDDAFSALTLWAMQDPTNGKDSKHPFSIASQRIEQAFDRRRQGNPEEEENPSPLRPAESGGDSLASQEAPK